MSEQSIQRFDVDDPSSSWRDAIERNGCCVVKRVVTGSALDELRRAIDAHESGAAVRIRQGSTFAIRNLSQCVQAVAEFARGDAIRRLIEPMLGRDALLMRSILFDKNPEANWHVGWHQDTAIAVASRIDVPGFGPWSMKAGVQHVRPPASVLEQVLTVRLHLDDCDESSGALHVLPARHLDGFLEPDQMVHEAQHSGSAVCAVRGGDVVLMRPLTPHASSPAVTPTRRRVVHLEFAGGILSNGLSWHKEC